MASPPTADPAPTPPRGAAAAWEAIAVVAFAMLAMAGFRNELDLHAWDEAIYYRQGVDLWKGHLDGYFLAWGPGLSLAYAILSCLPLGGYHPCDAMLLIVVAGSTLALWWAARAYLPTIAAQGMAFWWAAIAPSLVDAGPMAQTSIYLFVATLSFAALGCLARGRLAPAIGLLAYAGLTRPESGFFLGLLGIGIAWLGWRRGDRKWIAHGGVGVALAAGLSILHMTLPDARDRSWLVFRQHYAMGAAERVEDPDPVQIAIAHADPDPWMEESFGDAKSIAEAATANPTEFGAHVLANLAALPEPLGEFCTGVFEHAPAVRWSLLIALLLLVVVGATRGPQRLRGKFSTLVWLFFLASLLTIPINLLVRPRRELLLGLMPLIFTLGAMAATAGIVSLRHGRPASRSWPLITATLIVLAGLVLPHRYPHLASRIHDMRTSVAVLDRNDLEPGSRLMAYNAPNVLKHSRHDQVKGLHLLRLSAFESSPYESLAASIEGEDPDWLLVSPVPLKVEPTNAQLLAEITGGRWELVDVTPITMLYRRAR